MENRELLTTKYDQFKTSILDRAGLKEYTDTLPADQVDRFIILGFDLIRKTDVRKTGEEFIAVEVNGQNTGTKGFEAAGIKSMRSDYPKPMVQNINWSFSNTAPSFPIYYFQKFPLAVLDKLRSRYIYDSVHRLKRRFGGMSEDEEQTEIDQKVDPDINYYNYVNAILSNKDAAVRWFSTNPNLKGMYIENQRLGNVGQIQEILSHSPRVMIKPLDGLQGIGILPILAVTDIEPEPDNYIRMQGKYLIVAEGYPKRSVGDEDRNASIPTLGTELDPDNYTVEPFIENSITATTPDGSEINGRGAVRAYVIAEKSKRNKVRIYFGGAYVRMAPDSETPVVNLAQGAIAARPNLDDQIEIAKFCAKFAGEIINADSESISQIDQDFELAKK